MLRRVLIACAAGAIAAGGCGGGEDEASSPLGDALGYLPPEAALVIAIETDPDGPQFKAAQEVARKFPFAEQLLGSLDEQLEGAKVDFDRDLRPLLGNPFVIGAPDAAALQEDDDSFIGAIDAKDSDKLAALIERGKRDADLKDAGEKDGVKLYEDDDGDVFGVDGSVLLFANSRGDLESAVETRDGDERFEEDDFDSALEGLPSEAALRVYGNLERILAEDPDTAKARKVKWVSALRTFGVTGSIAADELALDFKVNTEGVSEADLPLASGPSVPPVLDATGDDAEVRLGLRDFTRVIRFAEKAGQAINPGEFGQYAAAKKTIDSQLGIDLDADLIEQFTGNTAVLVDLAGNFAARSVLADPRRVDRTLARAARSGAFARSLGLRAPRRGEDLYTAEVGGRTITLGVVEDQLVVSNDDDQAGDVVSTGTEQLSGAKGALVGTADGEGLANALIERLAGGVSALGGSIFTGPLGLLTGSIAAGPDGLAGRVTLTIE